MQCFYYVRCTCYIYMRMYVCVYMCVYVCVYICVCMYSVHFVLVCSAWQWGMPLYSLLCGHLFVCVVDSDAPCVAV